LPKWQDTLEKLAPYPVDEKTGLMIGKDVPLAISHRHFSHLLMIYPLYLLNWDEPENRALIEKSLVVFSKVMLVRVEVMDVVSRGKFLTKPRGGNSRFHSTKPVVMVQFSPFLCGSLWRHEQALLALLRLRERRGPPLGTTTIPSLEKRYKISRAPP